MERQKHFIILLLLLIGITTTHANFKTEIYKAYISSDMNLWKKTIDEMNLLPSKTIETRTDLLNYQYGYIGWCMATNKHDLAEKYMELAEKNILELEKSNFNKSIINSYKSAFYGYKVGINMVKAPFYGPKSVNCSELAIKQDPANPYGYIQYANAQYFMPAIFGGSKKVALAYYIKSESIMKSKIEFTKDNWNYLNLLTMIAQTYSDLNDKINAKKYLDKTLKIEPNFRWVKHELYPRLIKKSE